MRVHGAWPQQEEEAGPCPSNRPAARRSRLVCVGTSALPAAGEEAAAEGWARMMGLAAGRRPLPQVRPPFLSETATLIPSKIPHPPVSKTNYISRRLSSMA